MADSLKFFSKRYSRWQFDPQRQHNTFTEGRKEGHTHVSDEQTLIDTCIMKITLHTVLCFTLALAFVLSRTQGGYFNIIDILLYFYVKTNICIKCCALFPTKWNIRVHNFFFFFF
jgi:hypothetical protein